MIFISSDYTIILYIIVKMFWLEQKGKNGCIFNQDDTGNSGTTLLFLFFCTVEKHLKNVEL